MSRLTVRGNIVSQKDINKLMELSNENKFGTNDAYYKLKEYEDLEENGQLVKLPCKIGDFMYDIDLNSNTVTPIRIDGLVIHKQYNFFAPNKSKHSYYYQCCTLDAHGDVYEEYEIPDDEINKTVFLTEEDAKNELTRRHFNESRIK